MHPSKKVTYRIGAVAALSGTAVSTVRGWETRHAALGPQKSEGGHRFYTEDDVLRAQLFKHLIKAGHSISSIAALTTTQLEQIRLKTGMASQSATTQRLLEKKTATFCVVGTPLSIRLEALQLGLAQGVAQFQVIQRFADMDRALLETESADVLMLNARSLHVQVADQIQQLVKKNNYQHVIVLYNFGQSQAILSLQTAGYIVKKDTASEHELLDLIDSLVVADAMDHEPIYPTPASLIPKRIYSDETLARVANLSTNVLCECPKHVAELIASLSSFEQYSKDCLNASAKDATLHAYLSSVAGTARNLFEQALTKVAKHEGIALA
jgi:DNA-binding transcriptional MerR regulator